MSNAEQMTMQMFLIDNPCVKDAMKECWHKACTEASEVQCCSGCKVANTCTSRCPRSYKFQCTKEELKRHIRNGLPVMDHNQGTVLQWENEEYGRVSYAIYVEEK